MSTNLDGMSRRGFVQGSALAVGAAGIGLLGTGEAQASPYAQKKRNDIESPQLYILDNGTFGPMNRSMMWQLRDGEEDAFDAFIPYWSVLIKHPQANILFDCAMNNSERATQSELDGLKMDETQAYPGCLELVGLKPEDIDILVLSHLHPDHYGYCDIFPNAKIYLTTAEMVGSVSALARGEFAWPDNLNHFLHAETHWNLILDAEFEIELLDGITMYNFGPGHNFGMLGLLVDLKNTGPVLLPSDALCYLANIDEANPALPPLRSYDYEHTLTTLDVIKNLADEHGAQIWPAHDPEWFEGMTKARDGYYD